MQTPDQLQRLCYQLEWMVLGSPGVAERSCKGKVILFCSGFPGDPDAAKQQGITHPYFTKVLYYTTILYVLFCALSEIKQQQSNHYAYSNISMQ